MADSTCKMPDCGTEVTALGYCSKHYQRFKKHGDPNTALKASADKVVVTADGLRVCKTCGAAKPATDYHRDKRNSDGLRAQCKPCRNGYMAGYYGANRDRRVSYEQNRRDTLTEHMRALDMARYERNKAKRVALASEQAQIRRARLVGVTTDRMVTVRALRKRLGDACCYCGVVMDFTRRPAGEGIAPNRATLEHVVPISRGGTHTFDNTALACHRCNVRKNAKTVSEWKGGVTDGREEAAAPRGA